MQPPETNALTSEPAHFDPTKGDHGLIRGIGLAQATATNMLNMIGVGPFLTIPLVLAAMGGPQAMLGWILGAFISLCDGMVMAELGAAMPGAGGPWHFLREGFGPKGAGQLMSFLYLWQAVFVGPITTASGAVGFSEYLKFLIPQMTPVEVKVLAVGICALTIVLLYRDIRSIGRMSVVMIVVVLACVGWILFAGFTHFNATLAFSFPPGAFHLTRQFWIGLGAASLIALYDFDGYANVCMVGGEVRNPGKTIPRSVLLSIGLLSVILVAMNISIISVVPWQDAIKSQAIASDFIQTLYGVTAGKVITLLILWTAFGSVFALLLSYSRVPFTAAAEGHFFKIFARLHPNKRFPAFSLVTLGVISAVCCLFSLDYLISAMIFIRILTQLMAQCVAVILIRRNRPDIARPFSMWLFPLPAVVSFLGWLFVLLGSQDLSAVHWFAFGPNLADWPPLKLSIAVVIFGVGAYLVRAKQRSEWPFGEGQDSRPAKL